MDNEYKQFTLTQLQMPVNMKDYLSINREMSDKTIYSCFVLFFFTFLRWAKGNNTKQVML